MVEIASDSIWRWDADENRISTQGWALPNTDGSIPRAGGTPMMVRERLVGDEYKTDTRFGGLFRRIVRG